MPYKSFAATPPLSYRWYSFGRKPITDNSLTRKAEEHFGTRLHDGVECLMMIRSAYMKLVESRASDMHWRRGCQ
jgi:hypothetical protein